MPAKGQIEIEILADGTLKVESGDMGGANHINAGDLFRTLAEHSQSGGRKSNKHKHGHSKHSSPPQTEKS